jgi:glycine hydroxymethyltransferase
VAVPAWVEECERITAEQDCWRLTRTVNLIASENVMSVRARRLLASDFNHRYAEGHPGRRYYRGTRHIDVIEERAAGLMRELFGCARADVRAISGTVANEAAIRACVGPEDAVIVNPTAVGGHISHQEIGAVGKFTRRIEAFARGADGFSIDAAAARDQIARLRPKLIILGKSLILFPEPVGELADVCREVGAVMIYDGAHVLGLIAGGQFQDPLREGADLLLGSTHKTFFGPQRGVVLGNWPEERWKRVDKAVFPGGTSNHHLATLPPLLISALEMKAFGRAYAAQVVANARALAAALARAGVAVVCPERGYTQSHQVVIDVRAQGGGAAVSERLEQNDVIANMNMLPGDTKALHPSGIRLGVQEATRWGMKEEEMGALADLMAASILRSQDVRREVERLRARFTTVQYSFDDACPDTNR